MNSLLAPSLSVYLVVETPSRKSIDKVPLKQILADKLDFLARLGICFYQLQSVGQEGKMLSRGARLRTNKHFSVATNCFNFVMRNKCG